MRVDMVAPDGRKLREWTDQVSAGQTGKLYNIKVEPEAAAIISRYRGKQHLLRCFDRYQNYRNYVQHLNDATRSLGPKGADAAGAAETWCGAVADGTVGKKSHHILGAPLMGHVCRRSRYTQGYDQ